MILQDIGVGTIANDGTGDNPRAGALKINANNALIAAALSGAVAGSALTGTEKLLGLDGTTNKAWLMSQIATYVAALIVDSAPATLDTLNELAAALGDDPNFATTIASALAGKQPLDSDLTAIAALSPADDYVLQRKSGAWTARSVAQLRADIGFDIDRQVVVPADGGTTAIAASAAREILVYLNHTATIASHTFTLPALVDGQRISFRARSNITATTITPASGTMLGTIASFTANGHASWEWQSAGSLLWRGE